jgi:hypothetical protein
MTGARGIAESVFLPDARLGFIDRDNAWSLLCLFTAPVELTSLQWRITLKRIPRLQRLLSRAINRCLACA